MACDKIKTLEYVQKKKANNFHAMGCYLIFTTKFSL